jgi:hypothetical protein
VKPRGAYIVFATCAPCRQPATVALFYADVDW